MEGGKLLATGSSGTCVFRPNIPCRGDSDKITKNKISKIVYGKKAERHFNREKNITDIVKQIKGYHKWCIIYDKFCKPPTYDDIFKLDKDIIDCKDKYYSELFDGSSKMLVGKYGGDTFEDYFINNTLINRSLIPLERNIYILLTKMKQLFIGLKEMYNHKLIHLDIKINNIILDGEYFKYIDFGLSSELKDLDHFENRSLSEFNTKRIYIWYPLEYLYAFIDKSEQVSELFKFNTNANFRKHYEKGIDIYDIFDLNINNHIKELLNKDNKHTSKNHKELVSMIDTYSLGIIIPFFFVEYDLIKYIDKSPFFDDLIKLFKSMCKIDHKQRMMPNDCLKEYYKLIKKYSYLNDKDKKDKKGKKTKRKLIY